MAWGALALLSGPWRVAPVLTLKALATPSELGALAGALIVGWIASVHERQAHLLEEKLQTVTARASRDAAALGELRQAALALRARNDRLDLSLTFLRDVARRIETGDRRRGGGGGAVAGGGPAGGRGRPLSRRHRLIRGR